ncbi:MAG: plasmid mobilization protein [Bacteroidales bacterium]
MGVLSVRLSDQQKAQIEQAAKNAGMSVPEYARDMLSSNDMSVLKRERAELGLSVTMLRGDVEKLVGQAEKTAQRLSESLNHAELASERIRQRLTGDHWFVIGVSASAGFTIAVMGTMLGVWLMR